MRVMPRSLYGRLLLLSAIATGFALIVAAFAIGRVLERFVIHGIDEYTAITIVSPASKAIRARITTELGRGVTVYRGAGGLSGEDRDILYCVVTRLEVGRVFGIVNEEDEHAFVVAHALTEVRGGITRRTGAVAH